MAATESWDTLAAAHRARQLEAIPKEWILDPHLLDRLRCTNTDKEGRLIESKAVSTSGLLEPKELSITERFTAKDLVEQLSRGQLSSVEVVLAYCKRASLAQQLTSCLTEIFFENALARAKELDTRFKETGKVVGPLHGLPISLKDSFIVKGQYATAGYVEFLRRPLPQETSALVDLLLDSGAVLYCKTNVPQTMMTADSENNIFGRTLNPHNTRLTAGGSTGGEGALVAFRGSPLGVGTDIAGSIRIPSLCCGTYGFKPTADRIPYAGQVNSPSREVWLGGIKPAAGPIANSVGDLTLFMQSIIGKRPWRYDASVIDIPWRSVQSTQSKPLTIGFLPEDPEYPLHPPVHRALEAAALALQQAGHRVVRLPVDIRRGIALGARIGFQYFGLTGTELSDLSAELGEPLVSSVARGVHPFTKEDFPVSPELDVPRRFTDLTEFRDNYAKSWQAAWFDYDLDVLLAPGAVNTAVPHDTYGNPVYTLVWNVLDYPAGIIPFGISSKEKDPQYQRAVAEFDPDYDPTVMDGAPCSIQVIGPRFRDEECLHAMEIIDEILRRA